MSSQTINGIRFLKYPSLIKNLMRFTVPIIVFFMLLPALTVATFWVMTKKFVEVMESTIM